MNIAFTQDCNLRCPYCFARGVPGGPRAGARTELSLRDLKSFLAFVRKSKLDSVGVLGGEPTLHSRFIPAMREVIRAGLKVRLFTNGIMTGPVLNYLCSVARDRLTVILNINEHGSYTGKQWATIQRTMRAAHDRIVAGHTIAGPEFSGRFLVDAVLRLGLKREIRLGIAAPLPTGQNRFVSVSGHKKAAQGIVSFVRLCDRHDIAVSFDCGFRLCSFTATQLGTLQRANATLPTACRTIGDVGTDLRTWRCFALSHLDSKPLTFFRDFKHMERYYDCMFSSLNDAGRSAGCRSCRHFKRRQCTGGCLGHALRAFQQDPDISSLPHITVSRAIPDGYFPDGDRPRKCAGAHKTHAFRCH